MVGICVSRATRQTRLSRSSLHSKNASPVTGNRRLSVGLNGDATVTVLKWPSPSYYDQIKYRTSDRGEPGCPRRVIRPP